MDSEPNLIHHRDEKDSVRRGRVGDDEAIAELAERQHGVVARAQLFALGLRRGAIDRRLKRKRLHRIHRGVYAVGYPRLQRAGWFMAAVLACGPGAVLSHRCAAAWWGLLDGWPTRVDVSVSRRLHGQNGICVHVATIADDERTVHAGIPVTTVARTLLDLAAVVQRHELNRVLERAEALQLSDATPLIALMERHHGRRGLANLKAAMSEGLRPVVTRSELERRFLTFLDLAGLPRPETNVWLDVGGDWMEVDCVWREQGVIAELDSRAWHLTTEAFERDRERDRRALAAGWRPVRVTDRALRDGADRLREELSALVAVVQARSA